MTAPVTIYDSVSIEAIPADATALLAYIDGNYQTYNAARARFPTATILTVTVTGRSRANIIDVEGGDATPLVAAQWVRSGLGDTIYSSLSTKPSLDEALAGMWWNWYAADPTGWPHIVVGSVATQWGWPGIGSPGAYDISWANATWLAPPAPAPVPKPPPPPPQPSEEEEMPFYTTDSKGTGFVVPFDLSSKTGVLGSDVKAILDTGKFTSLKLTDAQIGLIPNA